MIMISYFYDLFCLSIKIRPLQKKKKTLFTQIISSLHFLVNDAEFRTYVALIIRPLATEQIQCPRQR